MCWIPLMPFAFETWPLPANTRLLLHLPYHLCGRYRRCGICGICGRLRMWTRESKLPYEMYLTIKMYLTFIIQSRTLEMVLDQGRDVRSVSMISIHVGVRRRDAIIRSIKIVSTRSSKRATSVPYVGANFDFIDHFFSLLFFILLMSLAISWLTLSRRPRSSESFEMHEHLLLFSVSVTNLLRGV